MPSCSISFGLSVIVASDVEPVGLNLIDQRGARNAELLRGPRAVAAVEPERLLDVRALHLRERLRLVPALPTSPLAQVSRQVLDAELCHAAREDHGPLDHVAHLAH